MFGCMEAVDESGSPATLLIYEDTRHRYLHNTPAVGDCYQCRRYHASVFIPLCRIVLEHVCLRHLPLPNDILMHYFPIFLFPRVAA